MLTPKQELAQALAKVARLERKLATLLAREAAVAALARHGVRETKLLLAHVGAAISVRDADADHPVFTAIDPETGSERPGVSVDDVVAEFRRSADFAACFGEAKGKKTAKPIARNPWRKGPTFNATEQVKLLKANPALAAQMMEDAGSP